MDDEQEQAIRQFRKMLPKEKHGRVKRKIIKALRRATIAKRTLLLTAIEPLPRHDLGAFWEELGAIHGVIAKANPDVDQVTIKDVTGQTITVPMDLIIAYAEGRISDIKYRAQWVVKSGSNSLR